MDTSLPTGKPRARALAMAFAGCCALALLLGAVCAPGAQAAARAGSGACSVTLEMPLAQAGDMSAFAAPRSKGGASAAGKLGKTTRGKLAKRFTQAVESMKTVQSARVVKVASLKIACSKKRDREIARLLGDIVNFHPEYFYVSSTITLNKRADGRYGSFELNYAYRFDTLKTRLAKCEKGLKKLLSWVPANGTDAQKAKAVHDWLVRTCTYDANVGHDKTGHSPYNIYGALVTHKPVCQGYSLTFLLAMQQLGIEATCVGQYIGEQGHMWNRVKVDGNWYHVDLTFDDPLWEVALPTYRDGGFYATPSTRYFLKSDSWWKAHAASGGWHKSWYPKGRAGTDTGYDTKKTWETYSRAAADPAVPTAAIVDLDEVARGTRLSLGSGSTRAVYQVSGTGAVRYRSCKAASGRAEAKVPAKVGFRGRSYRVAGISRGAFSARQGVRTVRVAGKELTAESVRGCFEGSKVAVVKVPASKKAAYKKIFAKANSGRAVRVRAA